MTVNCCTASCQETMEKVSCKCHSFVSRQHTAWQLTDTFTKAFYPVGQKASYKRPQVHKYRHKPTMARISCKCIHNLVPLYTHTHTQAPYAEATGMTHGSHPVQTHCCKCSHWATYAMVVPTYAMVVHIT